VPRPHRHRNLLAQHSYFFIIVGGNSPTYRFQIFLVYTASYPHEENKNLEIKNCNVRAVQLEVQLLDKLYFLGSNPSMHKSADSGLLCVLGFEPRTYGVF